MRRVFLWGWMLLALSVFAQGEKMAPPDGLSSPAMPPKGQREIERHRKRMEREQLEIQRKDMETFRKSDPEGYKRTQENTERAQKISQTMAQLHRGELSREEAKKALIPLMKPLMRGELSNVPSRIAQLEQELAFLKKVQKNPDMLVRRRVEEMIGEQPPGFAQQPNSSPESNPGAPINP